VTYGACASPPCPSFGNTYFSADRGEREFPLLEQLLASHDGGEQLLHRLGLPFQARRRPAGGGGGPSPCQSESTQAFGCRQRSHVLRC
jgi:hypothetical protein